MKYITTIDGCEFEIEIIDEHKVSVNGEVYAVDFILIGDQNVYSLIVDGKSYDANVYLEDDRWHVLLRGALYEALVEDEREKRLRASLGGTLIETEEFHLKAPMPGLVVAVPVHEGEKVEKGDVLLILESMKMQNELKAPRGGSVARVRVKPGDRVEQKETMLSLL